MAIFLGALAGFGELKGQTYIWTWMSGDNTVDNNGIYGTKGVPAAANKPGNRSSQSGWMDGSGNFWIFGGQDFNNNYYNDLWEYVPGTGQWAWISGDFTQNNQGIYGTKGVAVAANKPGSRYGQSAWVDGSGNFWIFGGFGIDVNNKYGWLNDLWKYTPSTGLWTWVSGDNTRNNAGVYGAKGIAAGTNKPGGRFFQSGWIDGSGNFWIFGGQDRHGDCYNDLWKYAPSTGLWTWVSGDNTIDIGGIYGTKGTAAAANKPGNRDSQAGWMDASGNFWIFGGEDVNTDCYNDLWKYTPSTGLWTWVSGDNTINNPGVYGTKGTAAAANKPVARFGMTGVKDGSGNFWIFGGSDVNGNEYNDLWRYNPTAGQWTWISGDNSVNNAGVYGTKGVGSATNKPGARVYQSGWVDGSSNLWIFAAVDNNGDAYNDLWKFSSLVILAEQEISFQGINHDEENVLSWQTIAELNTAGFEIERSTNGRDFTVIGKVRSIGSGNNNYTYIDNHLTGTTWYYRLKEVDMNGGYGYSRIIVLSGSKAGKTTIYPNPAKSGVTLQIADNTLLHTPAWLFDAGGKMIREMSVTSSQQFIDLQNLPKGILLLKLSDGKIFRIISE